LLALNEQLASPDDVFGRLTANTPATKAACALGRLSTDNVDAVGALVTTHTSAADALLAWTHSDRPCQGRKGATLTPGAASTPITSTGWWWG